MPTNPHGFDYYVTQIRVYTFGFNELKGDEVESEEIYRGYRQLRADDVTDAIPEYSTSLKTLTGSDLSALEADAGRAD